MPTPAPKIKAKTRRIKAFAVLLPLLPIAHCLCHNGRKMLMIGLDKKSAESFACGLKGAKIKEILITFPAKNERK